MEPTGVPGWVVLLILLAAISVWMWLVAGQTGHDLPGNLRQDGDSDDSTESIYDWAGSGDFHAYVPNREAPGQCAAVVGENGRQCLMSRRMHDA